MEYWESPIEIQMEQIYEGIKEEQEQLIVNYVNRIAIKKVNVEELKAALEYSERSYYDGYHKGFRAAKKEIIKELTDIFDYDYWLNDAIGVIEDVRYPREEKLNTAEDYPEEDYEKGFDVFLGQFTDDV